MIVIQRKGVLINVPIDGKDNQTANFLSRLQHYAVNNRRHKSK